MMRTGIGTQDTGMNFTVRYVCVGTEYRLRHVTVGSDTGLFTHDGRLDRATRSNDGIPLYDRLCDTRGVTQDRSGM